MSVTVSIRPAAVFLGTAETAPDTVCSVPRNASSTCSALLAAAAARSRRELHRPVLGRPRDVEPLRQLHLRHQQKHHDRGGQTLSAASGALGGTPEAA